MAFEYEGETITEDMERAVKYRETLARIDQTQADLALKRQQIALAPWQMLITGVGAGIAFLGAALALAKFLA